MRHANLLAALWATAALFAVARSRGAMLALLFGALAMSIRFDRYFKAAVAVAVVMGVLAVSGLSVDVGSGRSLSAASIAQSVQSLTTADEQEGVSNFAATRQWRTDWWSQIWDDANSRGWVLAGRGWADNLAVSYGIIPEGSEDELRVLRSPHNIFFSLLGRSGFVVAIALVVIPLATFYLSLRRARRTTTPGVVEMARAAIAAGWVCAMTDVYYEAPQGAIVLWTSVGVIWWWVARPVNASGGASELDGVAAAAMGSVRSGRDGGQRR